MPRLEILPVQRIVFQQVAVSVVCRHVDIVRDAFRIGNIRRIRGIVEFLKLCAARTERKFDVVAVRTDKPARPGSKFPVRIHMIIGSAVVDLRRLRRVALCV